MYYDIVLKNVGKKEKGKIKHIENDITKRVEKVTKIIKENYPDYVKAFGITGPMARGEGTIFFHNDKVIGSDIDFAVVTESISPRTEKKLKKEILDAFSDSPIKAGILVFSPTIFKRPDLMIFEFVHSGNILYGRLDMKYKKEKIPLWEAIRLLTFRGGGVLFEEVKVKKGKLEFSPKFYYVLSKAILGCGEAILIAEKNYDATFKERTRRIMKSKMAKSIRNFLPLYKRAYEYRTRKNNTFTMNNEILLKKASSVLLETWYAVLDKMFNKRKKENLEQLKRIRSPFPTILLTRFYYTLNWLKRKKIRIAFNEPFIEECIKTIELLEKTKNGKLKKNEKLRNELIELWRTVERFWLPY